MKITSVNNELVKETSKLLQKKYREESGLFLLEGDKCIEEAISSGIEIVRLFIVEGYEKFKEYEIIETTSAVLSKISSTESARKSVAVAKRVEWEWKSDYNRVVLLEGIKDAGNLGTIIRTSCAFGFDAIILYGDTVDLYNPKCVRATVGNLWKIPVFYVKNLTELKSLTKGFIPVATLPKSKKSMMLKDFVPIEKVLVMFGAESSGLSNELINYANNCGSAVTIEMSEKVESLNLSISAGVIMYKMFTM